MIEENAFEVDDHEEDGSSQLGITQLIDATINDARDNKSVINLMREVECKEKAAEQAKEEGTQSSLDILMKLDECKKALQHAEETKDNLVRKLYVHKAILATKMEVFQLHSSRLLDDGDRFFQVLDQMSRSLETRLTSASMKKELAIKKKQENEAFAETAVACENIQMEKVEQELKSLKQEAVEISKLLECLIDGGQVLDTLHEELSDKRHNMNKIKEELDQGSALGGLMSILVASNSSLKSFKLDGSKSVVFESDVESPPVIAEERQAISADAFVDLQSTTECVNLVEHPRDVAGENIPCGKSNKKVKIKKNLLGNQKGFKKVKIKGLQARKAIADHRGDSSDDLVMVTLIILLIMIIVIYTL